VVGVTVDRYLLIVHRFRMGTKTHFGWLFVLFSSGFIINLPHFFNYVPELQVSGEAEVWKWASTPYSESAAGFRYEFWVHCIFIVLAPWISIASLNLAIFCHIIKTTGSITTMMHSETQTGNSSVLTEVSKSDDCRISHVESGVKPNYSPLKNRCKQDNQVSWTLLTVTVTFLVLLLWQCIAQCFWMQEWHKYDSQNKHLWAGVSISFGIAKMGIVIYSSVNCFLYFFTGSLFRRELRELISCQRHR